SGGLGIFAGSDGQATVSGALSEWTMNPAPGSGSLLVGGAGLGLLTVDSGGSVRVTGPGQAIIGREAGSDGSIRVRGVGSAVNLRPASTIVGQRGKGTIEVDTAAEFQADRLMVGQSALDNRVTASGQDTILGVSTELVVGDGGRGTLLLQRGGQGVVKRLVVGRESQADNRVAVEGAGTKLSGSGRIDVGEQNGRGHFEMFDTAEARPGGGLSVGIYGGSRGTLLIDRQAFLITPADAILGGGVSAQATATVQGGGSLDALDVLIFAQPSGTATMDVTGSSSSLDAARDLQVGFGREAAGPTLMRAGNGAFVSVGARLFVGKNGRFEVTGARVKVGATDFPSAGIVRVGAGGSLRGSGRVQGKIEAVNGGKVSPGSSPGTLTLEGAYTQQTGAQLEVEIAGTIADAEYDVLHVIEVATLGGTLAIYFVDGFAPTVGQSFRFLKADGGISGSFGNIEISGLAPGFLYTLVPDGGGGLSLLAQNNGVATTTPPLAIARGSASIAVSWPATGTWILESTFSLNENWLPVSKEPILENDRYVVTLPTTEASSFFRLRR
ncbi:MAG TPA: hypothetical protein PLX89_18830, partial [Verrucomicrobiota bacterium]|nr:hypothetical protein [Verrucomicrobiota bacterium]